MRARQEESLRGFAVEWIDELPANLTGCIFSNEFFDALPVYRFRGQAAWKDQEILVAENFAEIESNPTVDVDLSLAEGQIADVNLEARAWIRRIAQSLAAWFPSGD